MITVRTKTQLNPVLMDPKASGPQEVYYVIRPETQPEYGKEPNITVIPPARLGSEFPKTFGHYHTSGSGETYRVLFGSGVVIIQKRDELGAITEVRALRATPEAPVVITSGYAHALINTSNDLLITADWESDEAGHDYEEIKKMHGMAYYVIDKDGEATFKKNPNYSELPEIVVT